MAGALAKGVISAGLVTAAEVQASDPTPTARATFEKETGARTSETNEGIARFARVLILAVKPAQVEEVLQEIKPALAPGHLLISIAAGVPLAKLENWAGKSTRVIRAMPNTPALVGASATAYALGQAATADDATLAQKIFSAVGLAFPVKEPLLDAVTGLSGSGPAYFYLVIEALSDGGVAAGLPRDVATKLAAQTALGSAKMILETGLHPGVLKDMVTSPGGTTIEGLYELEKGKARGVFMNAVRAAAEKSRQLGQR